MTEKCGLCKMEVTSLAIHWKINHKKVKFTKGKINLGFQASKLKVGKVGTKSEPLIKCDKCETLVKNIDQHSVLVHPKLSQPGPSTPKAKVPGPEPTLGVQSTRRTVDEVIRRRAERAGRMQTKAEEGEDSMAEDDRELVTELLHCNTSKQKLRVYSKYVNSIKLCQQSKRVICCPECGVQLFTGSIQTKAKRHRVWKEVSEHLNVCSLDKDNFMGLAGKKYLSLSPRHSGQIQIAVSEGDPAKMEQLLSMYLLTGGTRDQFRTRLEAMVQHTTAQHGPLDNPRLNIDMPEVDDKLGVVDRILAEHSRAGSQGPDQPEPLIKLETSRAGSDPDPSLPVKNEIIGHFVEIQSTALDFKDEPVDIKTEPIEAADIT